MATPYIDVESLPVFTGDKKAVDAYNTPRGIPPEYWGSQMTAFQRGTATPTYALAPNKAREDVNTRPIPAVAEAPSTAPVATTMQQLPRLGDQGAGYVRNTQTGATTIFQPSNLPVPQGLPVGERVQGGLSRGDVRNEILDYVEHGGHPDNRSYRLAHVIGAVMGAESARGQQAVEREKIATDRQTAQERIAAEKMTADRAAEMLRRRSDLAPHVIAQQEVYDPVTKQFVSNKNIYGTYNPATAGFEPITLPTLAPAKTPTKPQSDFFR